MAIHVAVVQKATQNTQVFFLFLCGFLFFSFPLHARLITADHPVRAAYEKLISCGVVEKPFYAQRTWTEHGILEALKKTDTSSLSTTYCSKEDIESLIQKIKTDLTSNFNTSTHQHFNTVLHDLQLSTQYISGGTSIYPTIGRGTINAFRNPLFDNEQGSLLGEGLNALMAAEASVYWKNHEFFVRPEGDLLINSDNQNITSGRATLHQAYGFFHWKYVDLIAGRAPMIGGQGEYGGFLYSENARPLDLITLTNTEPIRFPWIFKHLGKYKFSFITGNHGPEHEFPWAFFSGVSIDYKPVSWFELNLSHLFQFGGENNNQLDAGEYFASLFNFIPSIFHDVERGANKITEADLRFFIDRWMGLQGSVEYSCDDANTGSWRALKKHFTQNSSWRAGLYATRFLDSIADSLRAQFTITAPIAYRHSEFNDGWTQNGFIIGNPLGPDGKRIDLAWTHDWRGSTRLGPTTLTTAWEMTDNYFYVLPDGLTVNTTSLGPTEKRYLLGVTQRFNFATWNLKTHATYLHLVDADYIDGDLEDHFRVGAAVEIPFN